MSNNKGPCGCEEKKAFKVREFRYDRTSYNVEYASSLSESQFVEHPMHNDNYTDLPDEERVAQLKTIYKAILATIQPLERIKPIVPKDIKEPKESAASEPTIDADGTPNI